MQSFLIKYVPAVGSLRGYSWDAFRRDLFAGTTVAAVAVPQAIAYAMIFNMPAEYGLYTAIVMTVVGSLLASSKQLINGPTNVISIAMLSALAVLPEGVARERWIEAAILMAFLVGGIQTAIALLRLGDLSRYISHAVIVGFTAGASVLLILDQLKNALGLKSQGDPHDHFLMRFWLTMTEGGDVNWVSLAIASGTIAVTLALRSFNRRFKILLPDLLMAIVLSGFLVWFFDLGSLGVKLVDKVPPKLPGFAFPLLDWELMRGLIGSATAIALLGLLEAIAMSKSLAARSRQKLDINQQCLSEGLANLAGSFFHCFPGSGSLTRSYINYQAGAVTQWSGVICAGMVALTIIGLAPLAQFIPKAALAGVLLLTATRMIDLPDLKYHIRATRFDAIIVVATALAAVFVSIEYCILIGVLLSFLCYVPRAAKVEVSELVVTSQRLIRDRMPSDPRCAFVRIYNFEGELFFGSAPDFEDILDRIEHELKPPKNAADRAGQSVPIQVVLLRLKHVRNLDAVCLHKLGEFLKRVKLAGVQVGLTGIRDDVFTALEAVGIVEELGRDRIFRENQQLWSATMAAVSWAYQQLGANRCVHCSYGQALQIEEDGMHFMI
jgi:SulP family sulfate permease